MHSSETNRKTKRLLNTSAVEPRFGSTKLAAGAPHIRAFCECVGVCAIRGALTLAVFSALLLITALPAQAKAKETILYDFCSIPGEIYCTDGSVPSGLTPDAAGNLYGTTYAGGAFGPGEVFELSPNGNGSWDETVLYSFTGGADGNTPYFSDVIFDSVGNLTELRTWAALMDWEPCSS
ncbi:MAG: choice-of-anchor tandem repeat GloVer-containing protein [Terriglobales bacterium]